MLQLPALRATSSLLLLLLNWPLCLCSLVIVGNPESVSKYEGDSVTLRCRTQPSGSRPVWSRDNVVVLTRSVRQSLRYSFGGDSNIGVHDLLIKKVQVNDTGGYRCQVADSGGSWPVVSEIAHLRIFRNADSVGIAGKSVQSDAGEFEWLATVTAEESVTLECVVRGSSSAAGITWRVGDSELARAPPPSQKLTVEAPLKATVWMEKIEEKGKLYTVRSKLQLQKHSVLDAHHNARIFCVAQVEGFESQPLVATVRLFVRVPPTVRLLLQPRRPGNEYHEHDSIVATCLAVGRPNNFAYNWSISSLDAVPEKSNRLQLRLSRSHNGRKLGCTASNFASGSAEQSLSIRYSPRFRPNLQTVYAARVGDTIAMSCQADANPQATYRWRRVGLAHVIGQAAELVRSGIERDDFGHYECVANSAEFGGVSRRLLLAESGPPRLTATPQQYSAIGKEFRLRCRADSVPLPGKKGLAWEKDGHRLITDERVSILREDFLGGAFTIVHFKEVYSTDFGLYNCSVNNGFGSTWQLINFTIEDNIPIAFIAGASIALMMVLIFVVVLLCVCRRGYWETKTLKEAKRRQRQGRGVGCYAGPADSPTKQPFQPDEQEAGFCCQTPGVSQSDINQSDINQSDSADSSLAWQLTAVEGPAFALHGSLARTRRSPAQSCASIDLSDLAVHQQRSLAQVLSPRLPHQQQHFIVEEHEEPGQDDSVRSCDSGYGGAHAANAAVGGHAGSCDSSDSDSRLCYSAGHHVTFHPTASVIQAWQQCPIHSHQLMRQSPIAEDQAATEV